ncbi:MAG: PIG-L family deacetylase [Minicystis sp.]
MARCDHLVLSPHPDDAALSLGGHLAARAAAGERVLVVTVCTAAPPAGRVPCAFARDVLARLGLTPAAYAEARAREDREAARILGAQTIHAGLLDAPDRLPDRYGTVAALTGAPAAGDPIIPQLDDLLATLRAQHPGATLHAPLGAGGHVDHVLVHEAARRAFPGFRALRFYEDFPYAAGDTAAVPRRLRDAGTPVPVVVDVTPFLDRRIEAIGAYATQVPILFGSARAMESLVRAFAADASPNGGYAERLFAPA